MPELDCSFQNPPLHTRAIRLKGEDRLPPELDWIADAVMATGAPDLGSSLGRDALTRRQRVKLTSSARGETGKHSRLKICRRKASGFDSQRGHTVSPVDAADTCNSVHRSRVSVRPAPPSWPPEPHSRFSHPRENASRTSQNLLTSRSRHRRPGGEIMAQQRSMQSTGKWVRRRWTRVSRSRTPISDGR